MNNDLNLKNHGNLFEELKRSPEFLKEYRKQKPYYDIVKEIICRRRDLGLTQEQLAVKSGIPQSSISRIESAEHNIKLSTLVEIAEALDSNLEIKFIPIYAFNEKDYIKFFEGTYPQLKSQVGAVDFSKSQESKKIGFQV